MSETDIVADLLGLEASARMVASHVLSPTDSQRAKKLADLYGRAASDLSRMREALAFAREWASGLPRFVDQAPPQARRVSPDDLTAFLSAIDAALSPAEKGEE